MFNALKFTRSLICPDLARTMRVLSSQGQCRRFHLPLFSISAPFESHCPLKAPSAAPFRGSPSGSALAKWAPSRQHSATRRLTNQAVNASKPATAADDQSALVAELLQLPNYCAGCGVKLQSEDQDRPGWVLFRKYIVPTSKGIVSCPPLLLAMVTYACARSDDAVAACRYFKVPQKLIEASLGKVDKWIPH